MTQNISLLCTALNACNMHWTLTVNINKKVIVLATFPSSQIFSITLNRLHSEYEQYTKSNLITPFQTFSHLFERLFYTIIYFWWSFTQLVMLSMYALNFWIVRRSNLICRTRRTRWPIIEWQIVNWNNSFIRRTDFPFLTFWHLVRRLNYKLMKMFFWYSDIL